MCPSRDRAEEGHGLRRLLHRRHTLVLVAVESLSVHERSCAGPLLRSSSVCAVVWRGGERGTRSGGGLSGELFGGADVYDALVSVVCSVVAALGHPIPCCIPCHAMPLRPLGMERAFVRKFWRPDW